MSPRHRPTRDGRLPERDLVGAQSRSHDLGLPGRLGQAGRAHDAVREPALGREHVAVDVAARALEVHLRGRARRRCGDRRDGDEQGGAEASEAGDHAARIEATLGQRGPSRQPLSCAAGHFLALCGLSAVRAVDERGWRSLAWTTHRARGTRNEKVARRTGAARRRYVRRRIRRAQPTRCASFSGRTSESAGYRGGVAPAPSKLATRPRIEVAAALDRARIVWRYEPTRFVIDRDVGASSARPARPTSTCRARPLPRGLQRQPATAQPQAREAPAPRGGHPRSGSSCSAPARSPSCSTTPPATCVTSQARSPR